jgi:hypothetical protein
MHRRRAMRCLIASLPVLVLACGGSIGPIDPASLHIEGSYDFTTSAFVVDTTNSCCIEPNTGHPILSQHARLDIKKNGAGYDAVVTPDFGDPQVMALTVAHDGTVTLSGSVTFSGGSSSYASVSDELDALVFQVGSDGHFTGTYSATGQENVFEGDVGWMGKATASGNVASDARAPQVQASVLSSATSVVLPWDALYARMSEPVDAKAFSSAIALSPAKGTSNVSWQLGTSSVDWLGSVSILGYRTSWSDFSGAATLGVAGGLVDPSGNASSALSTQLTFVDVPKAATFSGATPPAMWGKSQIATGSDACGTSSSCVEIGPIQGPCTVEAGGIAGRLDANGSKLSVTFRLRAASQYGQPYWGGVAFSVASPGVAAQTETDPSLQVQFTQTTDPTYPWATDWVTANMDLPKSSSEIGFSLLPFGNASMYCGGGPAMPPVTLVVDVASISIK